LQAQFEHKVWWWILAAVCAVVVALAGCDGDETSPANDAPVIEHDGPANAAAIRKRVIGHTVNGTMGYGAYVEFYAPDGTIHGSGYRAEWRIRGDRLCLDYDESPSMDCYDVRLYGNTVEWWHGGEMRGEGTLIEGNPERL